MQTTKINLGLDLAGGSELLLEAATGDVAKQRIERFLASVLAIESVKGKDIAWDDFRF